MNPSVKFGSLLAVVIGGTISTSTSAETVLTRQQHAGWTDAIGMDNGTVEALIVPSIGRVMQFRFKGGDDVFWENPVTLGGKMSPKPWDTPGSFGGDKTWPAPQSQWNWPPPDVFDASPLTIEFIDQAVVLRSPVSPRFGIETERRIKLGTRGAVMTIETTYSKKVGDPVEVGVWVITQAVEPEAAFLPIPSGSKFQNGLTTEWGNPAKMEGVKMGDELISITRIPSAARKIGNDASSIVWVGKKTVLRIDSPRIADANYPDDGCSAEIYTNNDPAKYIEIETVGPLKKMKVGDQLSATNTYRLFKRTAASATEAARQALHQ